MEQYHKINGVFKRDEKGKFIDGEYSWEVYKALESCEWEWTEKVDGMNMRIHIDNPNTFFRINENLETENNVQVFGKTEKAQIPLDLYERCMAIGKSYVWPEDSNAEMITLYGEGFGPGIQKAGNKYGDKKDFVLFDVKVDKWWLKRDVVNEIADQLDIQKVPVVFEGTKLNEAIKVMRIIASNEKPYLDEIYRSRWGDFRPEGWVGVPVGGLLDRTGKRIITKLKFKDFE